MSMTLTVMHNFVKATVESLAADLKYLSQLLATSFASSSAADSRATVGIAVGCLSENITRDGEKT